MTDPDLQVEGIARRDAGLAVAAAARHRQLLILDGQLRMLDVLAGVPGRRATTDDACPDPAAAYADGGRWRGAITLGLARAGLIERVGYAPSCRPSRHGSPVAVWRLAVGPDEVQAHRRYLARCTAELQLRSGD